MIIKKTFTATMLSLIRTVAKIGFVRVRLSEHFFKKLFKEHYREVYRGIGSIYKLTES